MTEADELTPSARAGEILAGKYRVERVLGRGGMGLVLAARHVHLGEQVALKLLLPGTAPRPEAFARFLREGRAAARIRGEHVARVLDAGLLESGEPYLVLEYLDGVDLRALLRRRGRLPIATAITYALQVCEALAEAHAIGIVHRDLKPGNLFLTRRADGSEAIKVIDFGISKMAGSEPADGSSLTAQGSAIGTPSYMAPEQMRSARSADARADIWAIGAVLHGLVTGLPPFAGETMIEVYDGILRGPPSLAAARGEVPAALDEVVQRCLRFDPAERYQDVGELAAALAELATAEGKQAAERAIRIARAPRGDAMGDARGDARGDGRSAQRSGRGRAGGRDEGERSGVDGVSAAAQATSDGATIDVAPGRERALTEGGREPSWGPRGGLGEPGAASPRRPVGWPDRRARRLLVGAGVALAIGALAATYRWRGPPGEPAAMPSIGLETAGNGVATATLAAAPGAAPEVATVRVAATSMSPAALGATPLAAGSAALTNAAAPAVTAHAIPPTTRPASLRRGPASTPATAVTAPAPVMPGLAETPD